MFEFGIKIVPLFPQ